MTNYKVCRCTRYLNNTYMGLINKLLLSKKRHLVVIGKFFVYILYSLLHKDKLGCKPKIHELSKKHATEKYLASS